MQQLDRPRFRQDLVAEPIEDGGTRFIDVMDPDSGNVYRFFEVEYSLACAMDGERDVPGIIQWSKDELGLVPSSKEVQTVIATLGELGYLDKAGAPAVDELLQPGVVVGQKRVHTPAPDVELGHAGTNASAPAKPMPVSNIELAPGVAVGRPAASAKPAGGDIALGSPGRSDVSTDLADSVGIGVEDVKAAVRASQVMKAVDVPPELAAALEEPKTVKEAPRARNTPPPMPVVKVPDAKSATGPKANIPAKAEPAKPVESAKPVEAAKPAKPAEAAKPAIDVKAAAAEAKSATAVEAKRPVTAPPAPAQQASRPLIVVLVIVVLAAIGFLVYTKLVKSSEPPAEPAPPAHPAEIKPTPPPAPPAVESEKLATSPEQTSEIKPTANGQIETLVPNGAVKAGAVIATFAGAKPLQTEVAALTKDVEKRLPSEIDQVQKDIDAATSANQRASAQARLADRQKSLADKQTKLAAKQADLDKVQLKAPTDGAIEARAKVGAKVTANDVVFALTRPAVRTVKFSKADGATAGARVLLTAKADGKSISCIVTSVEPDATEIECPADQAATGADVTYTGLDTSAPADTGSASAPAGSAAPAATPPAPAPPPPAPHPHAQPKPAAPKTAPAGSGDSPAPTPAASDTEPAGSAQ